MTNKPNQQNDTNSAPTSQIQDRRYRPRRPSLLRRVAILVRIALIKSKRFYYCRILKMNLHPGCRFSLSAKFDFTNPRGIHIGEGSYVAFGAVILSHDMCRLVHSDTRIGKNCFIGAHSIVLPGVVIGDNCIIGSGSVVTKDVPNGSICAGNPAKVIRSGIETVQWGILVDEMESAIADANAGRGQKQEV